MPHFTQTISPNGPILQAAVMVSGARRTALEAANLPVPQLQRVTALIDTGASISAVDPAALVALGLTPTGEIEIHTPSTEGVPVTADTYDVVIGIFAGRQGDTHFVSDTLQVTSTVLPGGVQALLGRDLLNSCIFTYNGADGLFTLAY